MFADFRWTSIGGNRISEGRPWYLADLNRDSYQFSVRLKYPPKTMGILQLLGF